jgi:hypothetical protein
MNTQECITIWKQAAILANDTNINLSGRGHAPRLTVSNPWHARCARQAQVHSELVGTGIKATSRFYQKSVVDKFYELLDAVAQK